jgi:hypothetical protein
MHVEWHPTERVRAGAVLVMLGACYGVRQDGIISKCVLL